MLSNWRLLKYSDFTGGFANVVIPASVKAITGYVNTTPTNNGTTSANPGVSQGAFQNMTSLTNVTFAANNVTRIGAQAFKGCSNLSTISLPSSVTTINAGNATVLGAFEGSGLESVDLSGTGVTNGWASANFTHGAFAAMPNLTSVTLPAGLTAIPSYAFYNSPKLKTVKVSTPDQAEENQRAVTGADNTITLPTGLTSLGNNTFQGTGFKVVDLSATGVKSNISNSSTTGLGQNAFTNLANLEKVELPATSSLDLANFGGNNNWSAQYGPDSSSTQATVNIGNTNNFHGSNYNRISNSTIEMKSSNANGTTTLSWGVFNGNSTLKTLKLNRTATTLSATDNNLWAFQLGTAPNGSNLDAAYASAPLGNNSALTSIEFSGFGNSSSSSRATSFENINWSQVAGIMNMFSQYPASASESAREDQAKPSNLAEWKESSNWIQADLTGSDVNQGWSSDSSSEKEVLEAQENGSSSRNLSGSTQTATKKHNGVTWTYSNPGASSKETSTDNSIAITGSVNIYRSKNGSNSYQTVFRTSGEIF